MLDELFTLEGIFFDPQYAEEIESAVEDVTVKIISALQHTVEELKDINSEVGNITIKISWLMFDMSCYKFTADEGEHDSKG